MSSSWQDNQAEACNHKATGPSLRLEAPRKPTKALDLAGQPCLASKTAPRRLCGHLAPCTHCEDGNPQIHARYGFRNNATFC